MQEIFEELERVTTVLKVDSYDVQLGTTEWHYDDQEIVNEPGLPWEIVRKNISLKEYNFDDYTQARKTITNEFINLVREQSYLNKSDYISVLFDVKKEDLIESSYRRLITKINVASNYIATEGRVGPAKCVLMNPKHVKKLDSYLTKAWYTETALDEEVIFLIVGNTGGMTFIADSRIDENDFYVYRCNDANQPGIICVYKPTEIENELIYSFTAVGYFPYKHSSVLNIIE